VGEAEKLVESGQIDMVSFGRPFICNPVSLHAWDVVGVF
jgi:2,4-dienoyl-CoA reductase-like NADH-dependent reductase (Old Yellow Enzyme family)